MANWHIERSWIDLDAAIRIGTEVTYLSAPQSLQRATIVDIGASKTYSLQAGQRHDMYVLRGKVAISDMCVYAGDFMTQANATTVRAGTAGARIFLYEEKLKKPYEPILSRVADRNWRDAVNPHMRVVQLYHRPHSVSLVSWEPGARTNEHSHRNGEELFVLSGELSGGEERYPAGTWLRFHPAAKHQPFAELNTTILLRNGHLAPIAT